MTLQETIEARLVDHGLWPDEAHTVIEALKADEVAEPMAGRWHEDTTAYPPQMLPVLWIIARRKAAEWLAANKPKHFARALLEAGATV